MRTRPLPNDYRHDQCAYRFSKRSMDLAGSVIAIVVLSPVMLCLAVAIRLDSAGPALFRQVRLGRDLRPFTLLKFRTMAARNDDSQHRTFMQAHINGTSTARKNEANDDVYLLADARITRIGTFLRRISLDEIPNVFNVARGDMSLVGPRPPIPYEVEMYDDHALGRMAVKPGMTGLAQVAGRGSLTFEQVLAYDLEYIQRASPLMDLRILLRTIPTILRRRGV